MRFLISVLLLLPLSSFAKPTPEISARELAQKKVLQTAGRLNRLASEMNSAAAAGISVSPLQAKSRPPQISFVEQRNLLLLEGQEQRSNWYQYVRDELNAGRSLAGEPQLARLYFAFLQMQLQIDRDDDERIERFVAEAQYEANKEQARYDFHAAIQAELADGASLEMMYSKRVEHLDEPRDSSLKPDEVLAKDFKDAGRDQRRTAKMLERLKAEAQKIANDLRLTEALLVQAKEAAKSLPGELTTAFARPFGFPVMDRQGRLYTPSDWQAMGEKLAKDAPTPVNSLRRACAKLLVSLRAKD